MRFWVEFHLIHEIIVGSDWKLMYSTSSQGFSLNNVYRKFQVRAWRRRVIPSITLSSIRYLACWALSAPWRSWGTCHIMTNMVVCKCRSINLCLISNFLPNHIVVFVIVTFFLERSEPYPGDHPGHWGRRLRSPRLPSNQVISRMFNCYRYRLVGKFMLQFLLLILHSSLCVASL